MGLNLQVQAKKWLPTLDDLNRSKSLKHTNPLHAASVSEWPVTRPEQEDFVHCHAGELGPLAH